MPKRNTTLLGEKVRDFSDSRGNRVIGSPKTNGSSTIAFSSKNCVVEFEEGVTFYGGIHFRLPGGYVFIGKNSVVQANFDMGDRGKVHIGEEVYCTRPLLIVTGDACTVSIGDDCLFTRGNAIRAYDNHPIYDIKTRKRLNYARDITIGAHVWVDENVTILGGSKIGDGSIVRARSIVTASHPIGIQELAEGQPAKTVRSNVAWSKRGRNPMSVLPHKTPLFGEFKAK